MSLKRVKGDGAKRLETALKELGNNEVGKVGWFANSKYPDSNLPVAYVATVQEYGDPSQHIPPRPTMRPTITEKKAEWLQLAESGAKAVLQGRRTVHDVLESIGARAAGQIRKAISLLTEPPLSPRTIYERLHRKSDKKTIGLLTKPLIDTGILMGTLTNTVEKE